MAPLFVRDEHYKKRDKWRMLDEATRKAEVRANLGLEAKLLQGGVSPRTLRSAVLHRGLGETSTSSSSSEPPPPYEAPSSSDDTLSSGEPSSEETYDARAYATETRFREENESLRARVKALESKDDDSDSGAAAARIAALEREISVMRRQLSRDDDDDVASLAPIFEAEAEERPPSSRLWADAARRAAERRRSYRHDRAAVRAEEAARELRDLARKRRALSAPGPFAGLMRREAEMAEKKRERERERHELERREMADAQFKFKPPPKQRHEAIMPPPRQPTEAWKSRKTKKSRNDSAGVAAKNGKGARSTTRRQRWDAFVQSERRRRRRRRGGDAEVAASAT